MISPIITKDMTLFPVKPLPVRIKNVRARAQTLQDLNNVKHHRETNACCGCKPQVTLCGSKIIQIACRHHSHPIYPSSSCAAQRTPRLAAIIEGEEMQLPRRNERRLVPFKIMRSVGTSTDDIEEILGNGGSTNGLITPSVFQSRHQGRAKRFFRRFTTKLGWTSSRSDVMEKTAKSTKVRASSTSI
ncbi:unnamed protein product [Enterobius vermicularis]|uniref:Uncharacterized protein n=1 Tax=Enterobius vermicularis TaxID=51028 RepID=A0A0N4V616_ENTVE|nr:unnamed protein product [Enterobius vermicularis]